MATQCCPTCGRAYRQAVQAGSKLLERDIARAQASIACLKRWMDRGGEHISFYEAVADEINRLYRALNDHSLLWRIYQRANTKASSY